jgi:DNA polymerase-3 subunit beta
METATARTDGPAVRGEGSMEITVTKAELLKELTATQGVVERKTTIPILSNFLFETAGDKLSISATDLDLSLRTSCPAKVKKEGACTIPARKLYDYVKLLPDGDITIKLLDNHWVNIRSGRSNTKMVGMARANFPSLPAFPAKDVVRIPAPVLRLMIGKTIFAISNEESRYTLNGALMVLKAESITMVATDGHRLAHIENPHEKFEGVTGEMRTLVPKKAMSELNSLLQGADVDVVEFAKDESTLFFRIGSRLLTSRQLTGQFPNFEAVLPKDNTKSVSVRCEDIASAIQRVAQFADERSGAIKLRLDKNEIRVTLVAPGSTRCFPNFSFRLISHSIKTCSFSLHSPSSSSRYFFQHSFLVYAVHGFRPSLRLMMYHAVLCMIVKRMITKMRSVF